MLHKTTIQGVEQRRNGSLRGLAQDLGFSASFAATLSDVLHRKHGNVSLKTENRLRVAMGLKPIRRKHYAACIRLDDATAAALDARRLPHESRVAALRRLLAQNQREG